MNKTMKTYVFVAIYYPHYLERVIYELELIFKNQETQFIFIINNKDLDHKKFFLLGKDNYHVIEGSNVSGEFSAWDEGLSYMSERINLDNQDILYFMNDTFCHHRLFSYIDRKVYRNLHENPKKNELYGEVNYAKKTFEINKTEMNSWITSYFFMGRKSVIDQLLPFDRTKKLDVGERVLIINNLEKGVVKINFFSKELNGHLSKWLFPENSKGWHRSTQNNSTEKIYFKLRAIINEKLLSYSALSNGINIINIYSSPSAKIYNFLRYKFYNGIRRVKNNL